MRLSWKKSFDPKPPETGPMNLSANQFLEECLFFESQWDSATKPRVARNEGSERQNPNGVSIVVNVRRASQPRWGREGRCPHRPTSLPRDARTRNDRAYLLCLRAVSAPIVRTPVRRNDQGRWGQRPSRQRARNTAHRRIVAHPSRAAAGRFLRGLPGCCRGCLTHQQIVPGFGLRRSFGIRHSDLSIARFTEILDL